jgi:hypothetical protein
VILAFTGGGGAGEAVPEGFQVVQPRGPVQHALLEDLRQGYRTVDAVTGQARPTLTAVRMLPDLPANDVSFVVPKGGAGRNPPSPATRITGQGLDAARAALGKTPLWLGRSFGGHRLESVVVGTESEQAPTPGRMLLPARFARFDYGAFSLKEFGRDRPFWHEQDPEDGTIVVGGESAVLARDGLLLSCDPAGAKFRIDPAKALALARALRPVPG